MATITYSIVASAGNSWNGSFIVTNLTDLPLSTTYSTVTAGPFTISDTGLNFKQYAGDVDYITWRDYAGALQYPNSGTSLDIWCDPLYNDIVGNTLTWQNIIDSGAYTLSPNKNTLYYDYGVPYAPYWCRGGTIAFTTG
jgi:hypothetical protein